MLEFCLYFDRFIFCDENIEAMNFMWKVETRDCFELCQIRNCKLSVERRFAKFGAYGNQFCAKFLRYILKWQKWRCGYESLLLHIEMAIN